MRSSLPLLVSSLLLLVQPSSPAPQFSTLQNRFEGFNFNQLVSDLREQVRPKVDEVSKDKIITWSSVDTIYWQFAGHLGHLRQGQAWRQECGG